MKQPSARDLARRALSRAERRGEYLRDALDAELGEAGLSAADRGLATELVYGVTRHRSRLDRALEARARRGTSKLSPAVRTALRVAAHQILFLERVPTHAAVDDAVAAVKRVAGPRVAGFANGLLRALARDGEEPIVGTSREAIGARESLPAWIVDALAERVPADELAAAAAALNDAAELCLRVNPVRATVGEVLDRLRREAPDASVRGFEDCPGALAASGLGSPSRLDSFHEGLWTVQDVGAQWVGEMVDAAAKTVLDGCAGVGGKALQLAGRAAVRVVAADPSAHRLAQLAAAAERLGIVTVETVAGEIAAAPPGPYDAVLVDAPCTGLGVLRRHPERKWRGGEGDIAELASVQRDILAAAADRVRPGGELIYAVCTFTRAEGPDQVRAFVSSHPDFAIEPPPERPGGPPWSRLLAADGTLCTWPHVHGADAFFAARLRRRG